MTTNARPQSHNDAHWYLPTGEPFYEVPYADPKKGMRPATLADARKVGALPSVTTILQSLAKPELQSWIVEQAVLAVLTSPQKPGEALDAYVDRVLHVEKVHEQERDVAREKGIQIHDAMEAYFGGREVPEEMKPWIMPAAEAVKVGGDTQNTELILVGDGYAGRTDLIQRFPGQWILWDYKTTKKLPDPKKGGAYKEHRLQLGAYAAAWEQQAIRDNKPSLSIQTGNVYISTVDCGKFCICLHDDWRPAYAAFRHLLKVWEWDRGYSATTISTAA